MPADDTKLVVASHNTHHTKPKSTVPPHHSTPLLTTPLHQSRVDHSHCSRYCAGALND